MIGVLVFPNFQLLDAAGPISVFEIAARFAGQSPSIKVLAVTPGPVRSSSGVEMLTVEDLAEQAGMSSRHFTRAFIAETGSTPSKAVERLRIEVARQRVQSSSEAIERVAQLTGFRDPERMRRAFIRPFGHPPQSLRRPRRAG